MDRIFVTLANGESRLPIFVLDTCSALNLSKLFIQDAPLLLHMTKYSKVRIPKIVWDEYKRKFSIIDEGTRELWTSFRDCKIESNMKYCEEFIKKEAKSLHIKLHEGEKSAIGLTLWLSRNTSQLIILITDDFDISEGIYEIIEKQYAGRVLTSFDLIIFLFSRLPSLFPIRNITEDLLRDLYNLFPRSKEKDTPSEAERKYVKAMKELKRICRYYKCSRSDWTCYDKRF